MRKFEEKLVKQAAELRTMQPAKRKGSVKWESPSNIAIVKYWGKYPSQIPANASFSLTLSEAVTSTEIEFEYDSSIVEPELSYSFHGEEKEDFRMRISRYLETIEVYMPWLKHTKFTIRSENTFPHSSGIASSASAMSALALGLCDIEQILFRQKETDFYRKASFLSRMGSGSAARSVYGKMSVWGLTASCKDSSDEYAIPAAKMHPDFENLRDSILIIESGKKHVSSSMGHNLMKTNPYAKLRFEAAEANMQKLCNVVQEGDTGTFIDIMENEALSLHAMMMTSNPGYMLMKPNTVAAIHKIRQFREESGKSVGFTLDAGANVHVIYFEKHAGEVQQFIENELRPLCENENVIHDRMGDGPRKK